MAAVKGRKDSRGYVLRNGETQRKDGRYCFAYTDRRKKRHYIYAQTLTDLREKEKSLQLKYDQGLDAHSSGKLTVNDLYDKYISLKFDLKQTTKANYLYMYNHFVRHSFGKRKLAEVRYSDVKEFYNSILQGGMLANTLENIHTQVHPAFRMAVQDGLILCNPASDVMREIKRSNLWVKPKRHALTIPQQKAFLNFLENNRDYEGWIPIITVLLGTGMRIGDFFILPSSIHEILLVKDDGQTNADTLRDMVQEVNATQVSPEEKLTDNVYHYDSQDHVFELAEKFEARQQGLEETAEKEETKDSLLDDLKSKKEEVAKQPKKDVTEKVTEKNKGGEAI